MLFFFLNQKEVRDEIIKDRSEQIYELECLNEEQEQALKTERETKNRVPQPLAQPAPQLQQHQQQQQQQHQPQKATTQQPIAITGSKEEISSTEKQQSQPTKPKTTRRASKEGGIKEKKENKEEKQKKKQEKEKEEARRTSVTMSLKEAKAELEEIRKAGEARENLVKELKLKLETETARFEQEKMKFEEEIQFHKMQTESKNLTIFLFYEEKANFIPKRFYSFKRSFQTGNKKFRQTQTHFKP